MPVLIGAGFKVHVFDLLGYGLSERPRNPEVDMSVSGQVPVLEGLMTLRGLKEAHVVSHEIGGDVAQRFCVFSPSRVRSLTLIDVVSFDSWPSSRTREQMQEGLELFVGKPDGEHRAHFREWLLSTVSNKRHLSESALDTYFDFVSCPVGQASLFQHQVGRCDHRQTEEIADHLSELGEMPVQIVRSEDDQWQVVAWAHKLHDAIPNSELHVLNECGHFAMEDKPTEVGQLLVSFRATHCR